MGKGNPHPSNQWKPGQSGNPKGRPKKGETVTDAIRDKIGPELLAEKLLELVEAGDLAAIKYATDRQDGRPIETVNSNVRKVPDVVGYEDTPREADTQVIVFDTELSET